jgi:hypothetical protein
MSFENPLEDILKTSLPYKEQQNALLRNQEIENQYLPEKLRLANENQMNVNKWYEPNIRSEIGNRNALTQKYNTMTPLEAAHQQLENEWYAKKAQSDINYKNMGGGRGSTGAKDDYIYQQNVAKDNPQLKTEDQIREAANAYARGEDHLADGTPLNPISPDTQRAYDRAFKSTTNAGLVKAGVQANQADAELKALTSHVAPVIKDVGTTYFNRSPEQLYASFSNKPAEQKKLGRIIGARSLQYAIAQLRNRIDMGEPGINATHELMQNSGQVITALFPRITPVARAEADRFVQEGVEKALKARNAYGVGASGAAGRPQKSDSKMDVSKMSDEELMRIAGGG